MRADRRGQMLAGGVLIGLGLVFFAIQYVEPTGTNTMLLFVGALFVAAYVGTRQFGMLIPGGVLLGLGLGRIGESSFHQFDNFTMFSLGLGFCFIYLAALIYEKANHWWALIPGGVLIIIGLPKHNAFVSFMFNRGWPLILVAIGLIVMFGGFRRAGRNRGV